MGFIMCAGIAAAIVLSMESPASSRLPELMLIAMAIMWLASV